MKTTFFFLLLTACLGVVLATNTLQKNAGVEIMDDTKYALLWAEVKKQEELSLPESALEKVNRIYEKALQEKNSAQLIKAIIHQLKYQTAKDRDQLPERLKEIEAHIATTTNVSEQSMLRALLAQLYWQYYQMQSYTINQRTAIAGDFVPEDIREWSGNLFIKKVVDDVFLSVKNKEALQNVSILEYRNILTEGETSRKLYPTVYDFLLAQGIETLNKVEYTAGSFFDQSSLTNKDYFAEADRFVALDIQADPYDIKPQVLKLYQSLLGFKLQGENEEAILMTDLNRLEYVFQSSAYELRGVDYIEALNRLEKKFEKDPLSVEVLHNKATFYHNNRWATILPIQDASGRMTYKRFGPEEAEGTAEQEKESLRMVYEICRRGIERFPSYERIGLLKNLQNSITGTALDLNFDKQVYPGKELELSVDYRNAQTLTIELYRINEPITAYSNTWQESGLYKNASSQLAGRHSYTLTQTEPFLRLDTLIKIPMNEIGLYELVAYANDNKTNLLVNESFSVSGLHSAARRINDQQVEILVTDFISGKPADQFTTVFYKQSRGVYTEIASSDQSDNGLMIVPFHKDMSHYRVYTKNDNASRLSTLPYYYNSSFNTGKQEETQEQVQVFTDRSIYRPGQTIFFKGIASASNPAKQWVQSDRSLIVVLRNANGEEVSRKQMRTNDFGSFTGEFSIPSGSLNGTYELRVEGFNVNCPVQVEEYKRPSFQIQFDTIRSTHSFGDKIKVTGNVKTFSGISLQQTELKYRVVRQPHWLWRFRFGNSEQISEGTAQTDTNGNFEFSFVAEKSFSDADRKEVFYRYSVETSATSPSGETQTANTQVSVGTRSMILSIKDLRLLKKENIAPIEVSASNLQGHPVKAEGSYQLFTLLEDTKQQKPTAENDFTLGRLVASGNFSTEKPLSLESLKKEASGRYRIALKANDDKGREVTAEQDFTLYSLKDKKPPYFSHTWLVDRNILATVGENVDIRFGSSAKDVHVLQDVFIKGKKLESQRFMLDNSIKTITIPFKAEYKDGVQVVFTFIKDGRLFSETVSIQPNKEEKKLIVQTSVFRDRLIPGQQEEWKISVKDNHQQTVESEVLAAMYDASLDQILPHTWRFSPGLFTTYWIAPDFRAQSGGNRHLSISLPADRIPVPGFSYDSFNWFGLTFYGGRMLRGAMAAGVLNEAVVVQKMTAQQDSEEYAVVAATGVQDKAEITGSAELERPEIQVRKDLNETAFFYPQLRTNKEGETLIAFTVPESNTTWKFMALAHTRDMVYGQLVEEAISQKKLMVTPNMPRFMRQGDEAGISTLVSNLSDTQQKGEVAIVFFDPSNEAPLFVVEQQTQYFDLAPGASESFSWRFKVPAGLELAGCKIIAQSEDNFSDGEQHLLPVLTNKVLVTESLPMAVSGKGSREFTFDKLINNNSKTAENYRLTLEFSGNPVWYAIQALPAMETPQNDNAVSWFAAYYANTLAAHIAKTSNIRDIIEIWKKQEGEKQTLWSNLEKNSELKALLLAETPWVLDARNETEQKQRLSLLFDTNRNQQLTRSAIAQLAKLQRQDGGWPWIEGMQSNTSITQWILYGLGSLERMNAAAWGEEEKNMQQQAIGFIDYRFAKAFEDRKRLTKDMSKITTLSSYEIEYLYVRSLYPGRPVTDAAEARDFYQGIVEKHWTKNTSLYHRALMAMVMKRAGKDAVAQNIVRSLREHATLHPDMGLYWANNTASPLAFFFQSATAVHTFIMEAFEEVGITSEEDMNALKLWLLKQKQTQEWESTPATVNAVYALLNSQTGENWLESKGEVSIVMGGKNIDLSGAEAGTGYIKRVYTGHEITPEMGRVEVTKADAGPAWGALYWQYFEESDKVTSSKTALHIEKKLFVERISSTGKTIEEVTEGYPVKVGDKVVVRLTLRTDRDMEFVSLKDMHGAGLEPTEQLSGLRWNNALLYYQTGKDASTNFFFDALPRGTYVLEYSLYAGREGNYSNGLATLQSMYAPEFISHSQGERIQIGGK